MNGRSLGWRRSAWRLGVLGSMLALAGCATVPRSSLQTLELEVVTPTGAAAPAARCEVRNALGEWVATAPGKLTLSTDASPLKVQCVAVQGAARGEATAAADVRGGRWGRALIGGGAGAAVGGLIGRSSDSDRPNAMCCGNLGTTIGATLGLIIGAGVGAGTAEPAYAYPSRLRVVLQPEPGPR